MSRSSLKPMSISSQWEKWQVSQCHVIPAQHIENMETVTVGPIRGYFCQCAPSVCSVYMRSYWKRNSLWLQIRLKRPWETASKLMRRHSWMEVALGTRTLVGKASNKQIRNYNVSAMNGLRRLKPTTHCRHIIMSPVSPLSAKLLSTNHMPFLQAPGSLINYIPVLPLVVSKFCRQQDQLQDCSNLL